MSDERLLQTFIDLVRLDSPPKREAAVAAYAHAALAAAGAEVDIDDSRGATGSDTGNLIAGFPATAPGRAIVFSAHMDCVEPCCGVEPVVHDGVVRSAGETVLGADDKAGIAAIIETFRRVAEESIPHAGLKAVLTVAEEQGLTGAKALDPSRVRGDLCLVLDADGAIGGIVTAAPTHWTFAAEFRGRAAHAGVCPEQGCSAIAMASEAVSHMRLGRVDEESTANIGTIHGGKATNVVAPLVTITGECRSRDRAKVEALRAEMDSAMRRTAERASGAVDIEWTLEYEGYSLPGDHPLVALVEDACADIGVAHHTFATGGGSDANIFWAKGVPALVLASGMADVHGTEEHLAVKDLEDLAALLVAIVRRAVE